MKKIIGILITVLLLLPAFTQQKNDTELKQYLIDNSFGGFKFAQDGTYTYYERYIGDSVEGAGLYSVKNGILFFESYDGYMKPPYSDSDFGDSMELPGKYKVDLEKTGLYNKGALINVSNGKLYWSNIDPPAYAKINYEGTDCIRYPWNNDGIDREYIVILENLKLRKYPSLKSPPVTVYGIDEDNVGYFYGNRSIALAGQTCVIRAKTIKEDTIDGITAPWYLILAYGTDEMGLDVKESWVFGGYVKEFKQSQLNKTDAAYREILKQSILKLGGTLY